MISLAKNQINGVTVELTVEETIGSQLGGYPIIHFGDVMIDSTMVAEVDTLQVIKAIVTSETVEEFSKGIEDCHNSSKMVILLKSWCELPDIRKVANTPHNDSINQLIEKECEILQGNLDEFSYWEKTMAQARVYDLSQQLELIE